LLSDDVEVDADDSDRMDEQLDEIDDLEWDLGEENGVDSSEDEDEWYCLSKLRLFVSDLVSFFETLLLNDDDGEDKVKLLLLQSQLLFSESFSESSLRFKSFLRWTFPRAFQTN
jgi:hypothetical protein